MRKSLLLFLVLLAGVTTAPVVQAQTAGTYAGSIENVYFGPPVKEWETKRGIYHARGMEIWSIVTGGIVGEAVFEQNLKFNVHNGNGVMHGHGTVTVTEIGGEAVSGTLVGTFRGRITAGILDGRLTLRGRDEISHVRIRMDLAGWYIGPLDYEAVVKVRKKRRH